MQKDTDSGAQITSWNDDDAQAEAEVDDSLLADFDQSESEMEVENRQEKTRSEKRKEHRVHVSTLPYHPLDQSKEAFRNCQE